MAASSEGQNRYLFLSDAHLGGFSKEKNRKIEEDLIELVDYCLEQQIQIAVLGDLFDYWMEYPGSIPALGKNCWIVLKNITAGWDEQSILPAITTTGREITLRNADLR